MGLQTRKLSLDEEERDHGAETRPDAEGDHRPSQTWRLRRWLVLAGVAAAALISITYITTRSQKVNATGPKIKSLAVLPLTNLSGDPEPGYFVDGLTDELTADLAKLGALRVISRTSAMLYRDTHKPLPQIKRNDDWYFIATLYAASGTNEKALDLLERGYAQHDRSLLELKIDPRLDNLRSIPRFQDLFRRMNFPE